ncbi:MAG: hypothetical protein CMQ75_01475 [Gammaproteobacteria bacterium]|nr:hypothetical protein [Gammaproteobacteria bacterium]RPG99465.1 MAG: hypothetical protein CBC78_001675 [Candidatus Pelagibacter sp. TMED118]|tara:strand:- start:6422 stop:6646 length:225 start_codon:yes stop_codon:yes gene_type:complete
MELYVLILSMWGKTASDEWLYIGNQYVYNTPMQKEQCENLIDKKGWSMHITNEYYGIKFDCMPESASLKEKKDG